MEGEGAGELPLDESNLVLRAARALAAATGYPAHARLHLRKQIPIAGGLAGGSADAAAALVACDALWGTGLSRDELAGIAADVGSDVPFLVLGGTALGTGRGEVLSPVLVRPVTWHWVIAVADAGLSTPAVYQHLDELRAAGKAGPPLADPDELLAALRQKDPAVLAGCLANDMQVAALSLRPELAATLSAGEAAGALGGIVSGSGPTCVFLARDNSHANAVADALESSGTCARALVATGPVAGARPLASPPPSRIGELSTRRRASRRKDLGGRGDSAPDHPDGPKISPLPARIRCGGRRSVGLPVANIVNLDKVSRATALPANC